MKGTRRLLLFDGFDSHCTKEFLEVLEENKITPYRLPAHTSHFLQPLDVGCFQPYKHWHAEAVDAATRTGCTSFNKVDFLYAIESIRRFTFKDKTIRRGWKDAGLLPHNWDLILHNIQKDDWDISQELEEDKSDSEWSDSQAPDKTPSKAKSAGSESLLMTPLTVRTLKRNIDHCMDKEDLSDNVRKTLWGAHNMAVIGDQAIGELRTMTSVAQERRTRQKRSKFTLKSGMGIIYAKNARKMVQGKFLQEMSELEAKYKAMTKMPLAAKKRHAKAYKPVHKDLEKVWASMRKAGLYYYEDIYNYYSGQEE
jgi:hypothetical protein